MNFRKKFNKKDENLMSHKRNKNRPELWFRKKHNKMAGRCSNHMVLGNVQHLTKKTQNYINSNESNKKYHLRTEYG